MGCLVGLISLPTIASAGVSDIRLHIAVSNQSLVERTGSFVLELDGRRIYEAELQTHSQHHYQFRDMTISPGVHKLMAREANHGTSLTREYEFRKETWIRVLYIYSTSQKKHLFELDISDERIFIK